MEKHPHSLSQPANHHYRIGDILLNPRTGSAYTVYATTAGGYFLRPIGLAPSAFFVAVLLRATDPCGAMRRIGHDFSESGLAVGASGCELLDA